MVNLVALSAPLLNELSHRSRNWNTLHFPETPVSAQSSGLVMDTFVRRQASTHSVTFANTGVPRSPATWPPDDEEEFIVPALTPSGVAPPPGDEDLDPFSLDDEDNPILPPGSYQMSPETGTPDNPGCGREETPPPSLLDQFLFGLASSEDDPTPPS